MHVNINHSIARSRVTLPSWSHRPASICHQPGHVRRFFRSFRIYYDAIVISARAVIPPPLGECTLSNFKALRRQHFAKRIYSIRNSNIPLSTVNHCSSFYLNTFPTYTAKYNLGICLFENHNVPANWPTMEYFGDRLDTIEANFMPEIYKKSVIVGDYFSETDDNLVIDATFTGNQSRYINSIFRPYVYLNTINLSGSFYRVIWFYSSRLILSVQLLTKKYKFKRYPNEAIVLCAYCYR